MLKAITEWMNGDFAGKTMLALRFVFFILFIVTAVCNHRGNDNEDNTDKKREHLYGDLIDLVLDIYVSVRTVRICREQEPDTCKCQTTKNNQCDDDG